MDRILCHFEVKNDPGTTDGIIVGYGSIFGNVDSYGDVVAKGAFRKTIADAQSGTTAWPAMLLQHGDDTAEGNPHGPWHLRMRAVDRDLIRGGHYGQRS